MNQKKVMIRGIIFDWAEKEPFVKSGASVLGALEWDSENDTVRCHECGDFFRALGTHIRVHGLRAPEYKAKHGLRIETPICGLSVSRGAREKAERNLPRHRFEVGVKLGGGYAGRKFELRNFRQTCRAQLIERIRKIAFDLGRSPTTTELNARGIWRFRRTLGDPSGLRISELKALAGLARSPNRRSGFSRSVLAEVLRDFYVQNKRLPTKRDWSSGILPSPHTFRKYCGSMRTAYEEANLLYLFEERLARTNFRKETAA